VDPIKLAALDQPIAPVELPNGRVAQVWPVNALARRLMRDNAAAPTDERNRAIIKLLIRDITDEELDSLSDVMTLYVIGIAADKVAMAEELIEEARKNVSAGTTDLGSRTRPSSPTTTSPTPAPASPEPSPDPAATGTSSGRRGTKSSSRSTPSKKSSGLTISSPTSTP
jgi:hypothetical protein